MTFAAQLAALDEAAFDRLADDVEAVWAPQGHDPVTVRVMVGPVERAADLGGVPLLTTGEAVRFLASELAAKAPGVRPGAGDTVAAGGRVLVLHGEAWREHEDRDWVCAVTAA